MHVQNIHPDRYKKKLPAEFGRCNSVPKVCVVT
jgi:hypothetical protein